MATRKKKKQRTMQLMASAALLSATVAPYVISADELTQNQLGTTNTNPQNVGGTTFQTTGDSANVSNEIENTIENSSEIVSSGGNTNTELVDNGTSNNNMLVSTEAITPTNVIMPTTIQSAPTFVETHNITLKFKNDKQDADSVMNGFVNSAAVLGITADGKKYVQMSVPATNKGWVTGFKATVDGQLKDALIEEKSDDTTVITFQVDSFDAIASWIKVDIDNLNYHHDYTVYLTFPNITNEYTEPVAPEENTPTTPDTGLVQLPTPDEVVDANAKFTFTTGEVAIDGYMGSYIKNAQVVRIGTQLYADIQLTGNTYAYTSIKLGSKTGADATYESNGLTGKDLVRTIRVPLDENKKSVVAMFGGPYDNTFTFDFAPVAKTIVTVAADLTAQNQVVAFAYSSATTWHAAAFPSTIKAAAAKAVNGKVQVTLQVDTTGLNSFSVAQNGTTLSSWAATSSLVTFTVDSLQGLTFTTNKTASGRTSDLTVNVDEVSLNTAGALPVETVVATPEPPAITEPGTVPTFKETHNITLKFKNDKQDAESVMDGYVNDTAVLGITADGKKYVQMTIPEANKGWITGFKSTVNGQLQDAIIVENANNTTVITFQLESFNATAAWVKVDIDAINYHHDYTVYLSFPNIANEYTTADYVAAPKVPSTNSNTIVKNPTQFTNNQRTPIIISLGQHAIVQSLGLNSAAYLTRNNTNASITFSIDPDTSITSIEFLDKNGKRIGQWTRPTANTLLNRVASLIPVFSNSTATDVTLETDSLEGITFKITKNDNSKIELVAAVEAANSDITTSTNPGTVTGGGGGATVKPPVVASDVENRESISYKMVSDPNGPMADFMTNYMNPYFSNAELVTVGGKNYIELTLTGKAYGFQNLRVTGGYKVISSEGEKMDQVRVIRFPAKKDVTIHVDSGELGYGAYDLLFTFELSEEQMKNAAAAGTGGITPVQTITPQIVSEGDVKFTIPATSSAIVTYAKKVSAKLVDGKYNVSLTLMTETDLETFVVKQGDKEIARWDKKAKSASLVQAANSNVLTFTVESLDDLTLIASTKNRTIEAKLLGEPVKKEEVPQVTKDGRTSMSYTMEADPAGPMADFIGGYLAPYFSNAVYVLENGKEYVELTLTGKAYGFATLQYIDANGKNVDIEVVSSTGDKLDLVRVVRLPLVQDKNGITKIFVDSGDLGYGAYTLFFKFNVPTKSGETAAVTNPFKDIDGIYSKDDILALYAAGITTGTTETTYSPNANMTRAQFAVMVARALGISSTNETKFKDVQGKWYAKEVQALAEIGIITGVSDTKFKPNDKITRQQAAVMIHRMLAHQGYTNTATAADLNFKDSSKISDYAKEAFAELQAQGILTGYEGKVNPTQNLTRAQMAKILKNAADLVGLLD